MKRGKANLLGGRAWRYEMFPLVTAEMEDVDLLRVLNHGMIPAHYLQTNYRRSLSAYVRDYLKEEVFDQPVDPIYQVTFGCVLIRILGSHVTTPIVANSPGDVYTNGRSLPLYGLSTVFRKNGPSF